MSRHRNPNPGTRRSGLVRSALICVVAAGLFTTQLCAQNQPDDTRDGRVEVYLRDRGLDSLLADHLLSVLNDASGTRRIALAERLGSVYARLLASSADPARRDEIVSLSNSLLDTVPGADTFDLRIALAKARYLRAEITAERARLHSVTNADREDAAKTMAQIASGLVELGKKADRRVQTMERRERSGSISDMVGFRGDLAEARRQRSLAKYYSGWANYYTAMLTDSPQKAGDALKEFGYLLGGDGKEPTIETLPKSLLRYEHVARAVVGVALCYGVRGEHRLAVDWLLQIEEGEDVNPVVIEQLFARRVTILTGARRWDSLARAVEQRREAGLAQPSPSPLRVAEARLLAVEVLESLRDNDADQARRDAAEPILQAALGDLIARGESGQVLNLVEQYGTLPLGDDGFIARYVRGLRAYRAARALHQVSDADPSEPTREPELVAAYIEAADMLGHAFDGPEAQEFADERTNAGIMLGMAIYYKDSPAEAADRFEQTTRTAATGQRHAEALWMTVVSLERAVENGRTDLETRLYAAAALYVRTYPGRDRAARLLLRFANAEIFDPDTSVELLLELSRSSPMYAAAREHVADTLYRDYVRTRGPTRNALASRFLPIAMERIEAGLAGLRGGDADAADRLLLRARQALDASLTPLVTDPASARRALAAIEELRVRAPGVLAEGDLGAEMVYRSFQLAIAEGDSSGQERAHTELVEIGGEYLAAADRFLLDRAIDEWERSSSVEDARTVVEIGSRLLGEGDISRTMLGVADAVARAATAVWKKIKDRMMLDAAVDLDRLVLSAHTPTSTLLRRLGTNAEDAGDLALAQRVWNRLGASLPAGEPEWFEARYQAIRLLAETDRAGALAAVEQHRVLYPSMGPDPWGRRFMAMLDRLENGAAP